MSESFKKILIVEDERPMAKALELKLGGSGFFAKAVFNGEEALEILKEEKFDLIILDLVMPRMSGFEFLEKLKLNKIDTPVIVASNLSQEEDIEKVKDLGAVDYFIKSDISISEIVERVRNVIENK
ncbi:response regulator transcription factor [Patescibacteria group bacterium]